jgi:hypothetical protein
MNIRISYRWLVSLGVTLGVLTLLWAIGSAMAQVSEPGGEASVAATVNSRISYQGMLTEDGEPVTGFRNMAFLFFSDAACSAPAAEAIVNNVPVTDGLFSVELDVPQEVFWGQGTWLTVEIGSTRLGCEEILPVPYALSLRPSAVVRGGVASPSAVLQVHQSDPGSPAFGLYGSGISTGIYGLGVETGVKGHSYGHVGGRAGVWGNSEMGVGVRATSNHNVGLWAGAGQYNQSIIEGHQVDWEGASLNRVFAVHWDGEVYADGGYHCGKSTNCWVTGNPADFAEVLPVANDPAPGEVLVVGPEGKLTRSTEPYQASVLGVYSTRPMYIGGGENLDRGGYAPLAVVGIVPVKVSAENGSIVPGDLLVSSSTPGHAMRPDANPPVGTVIGKALEGLDEGTGVIQMLVMLQ